MKEHKLTVLIVAIAFVLMCAYVFTFQVRTTETAIHYRPPGQPLRVINRPDADEDQSGLYFRLPFPIDHKRTFDTRTRTIDGPLVQTQLQDDWQVIVSVSALWRLSNPEEFERALGGSFERAEETLRTTISSETSNAMSDKTFRNLVSTDEDDLMLDELEESIRSGTRAAIEGFGLELLDFGLRRTAIPEATTREVFRRMEAERERVARVYLEEGEFEKRRIRAEAEREAEEIRSDAMSEARRIESEGEAAEAEFYEIFAEAPELAIYLRRLQSLRNIAQTAREEGSPISFVLDTRTEPLSVLYTGPQGSENDMLLDPVKRAVTGAGDDDASSESEAEAYEDEDVNDLE